MQHTHTHTQHPLTSHCYSIKSWPTTVSRELRRLSSAFTFRFCCCCCCSHSQPSLTLSLAAPFSPSQKRFNASIRAPTTITIIPMLIIIIIIIAATATTNIQRPSPSPTKRASCKRQKFFRFCAHQKVFAFEEAAGALCSRQRVSQSNVESPVDGSAAAAASVALLLLACG